MRGPRDLAAKENNDCQVFQGYRQMREVTLGSIRVLPKVFDSRDLTTYHPYCAALSVLDKAL